MGQELTNDFDKRFQLLELLSECEQSMAPFNTEYELLLKDIESLPGCRFQLALRLKGLQIRQEIYLRGLLAAAAKRDADCPDPEMEGHSQ